MDVRQTLQNNIKEYLRFRFGDNLNRSHITVNIDWYYTIYSNCLEEDSDGIKLSKWFNCVYEIIQSLNLFSFTREIRLVTEDIVTNILNQSMGYQNCFSYTSLY